MTKPHDEREKMPRKSRIGKCPAKCEPFGLDLMLFSTRDFEEIKDLAGLKAHLKECKYSRVKLEKLKMVGLFSFLASPRSEKFKKKMQALMDEIKASEKPGKKE